MTQTVTTSGYEAQRRPIFIAGFMACGKTTFGRALARCTGREFIDLDFRIEQRHHATVKEIFATRGEEEFRRMEADMLREVGELDNVVVSCGGGTPCFHGNIDYMLEHGHTVWLCTEAMRIAERLTANRAKRPLMADKTPDQILDAVNEGLNHRLPYYSKCRIHYQGNALESKDQIDNTIRHFLSLYPDLA